MPDIFISYAHEDRKRVQVLADALEEHGWRVWWDAGIRPGQNFRASIQESLYQARCVLVAWSSHSVNSHWAIDEAESGRKRNILIPVVIEEEVELPLGFGGLQTADITGWLKDPAQDTSFERLCEDIDALLGESAGVARKSAAASRGTRRRTSFFRRRAWWLIFAVCVMVALALLSTIFRGDLRAPTSKATAEPTAQSTPDVPVVEKVEYSIDDLRCGQPAEGGDGAATPDYTVDATLHLLLDKEGKPVSAIAAKEDMQRIGVRRLIVVHTTTQMLDIGVTHFTHILITRDGSVRQIVPFDYATNHAPNANWKGFGPVNKYSISIELENAGPAQNRDDVWYSWIGEVLPTDEVVRLKGDIKWRGWHKFTDVQVSAFFNVACALRRAYPTITSMVGHSEIDPNVGDPGPLFPIDEMRAKLFARK